MAWADEKCIRKDTFVHPLESDGAVILDAYNVHVSHIEMMDDDGGWKTTKSGKGVYKTCAVLTGWESNPDGESSLRAARKKGGGK